MTGPLNIDEVFAFILRDEDGTEGIIGVMTTNGWLPLVGADMERVEQFMPHAQDTATATGKTIQVCRFSTRTLLKEIRPDRSSPIYMKAVRVGGSEVAIPKEENERK